VVPRDEGSSRSFAVLVSSAQSGGVLEMFELSGTGDPPTHVHDEREEYFYVATGRVTFFVGDATIEAGVGDAAVVPRGTPHRFVGTTDLRMIVIVSPPGLEGYFQALVNGADRRDLAVRYDSRLV
jgi:mannose-6-phosphate isomerase-like protein (cupin superfamily)